MWLEMRTQCLLVLEGADSPGSRQRRLEGGKAHGQRDTTGCMVTID
jgi:hypothetical protein